MKQHPTDMTAYLPSVKPDETWLTLKDWERYVDNVLIELHEILQEAGKCEQENVRLRKELVDIVNSPRPGGAKYRAAKALERKT